MQKRADQTETKILKFNTQFDLIKMIDGHDNGEPSLPPNTLVNNCCGGHSIISMASATVDGAISGSRRRRSSPPSSTSSFSVGGIYRRKHTLRAIFRTASLALLLGGYALYNHFGHHAGDGGGGTSTIVTSTEHRRLGRENDNLKNNNVDIHNEEEDGMLGFSRSLQGNDATAVPGNNATAEVSPQSAKEEAVVCPTLEVAEPSWLAAFYAIGVLYMFLALAIVCDEFFVPALEEISCEHHLNLSMDVAGATLMAAGGSAPELFTSFVGTFQRSDIGIGTIVGSAVFNVLFVIGMCSILSREVLTLTWWPLFRDSAYYAVGLVILSILAGVVSEGNVYWWESLILLLMYVGYVVLMYYNRKLYKRITGRELVLGGESEETADEADEDETTTNGGAVENGGVEGAAPVTMSAVIPKPTSKADFRWPGTFRAGVLKLLLHPESWEDKGGVGIVAKIQGDVDHVFKQIDINGDGTIDKEELGNLFQKLGHELNEEELGGVFASLDLDGNGTVSKRVCPLAKSFGFTLGLYSLIFVALLLCLFTVACCRSLHTLSRLRV